MGEKLRQDLARANDRIRLLKASELSKMVALGRCEENLAAWKNELQYREQLDAAEKALDAIRAAFGRAEREATIEGFANAYASFRNEIYKALEDHTETLREIFR